MGFWVDRIISANGVGRQKTKANSVNASYTSKHLYCELLAVLCY